MAQYQHEFPPPAPRRAGAAARDYPPAQGYPPARGYQPAHGYQPAQDYPPQRDHPPAGGYPPAGTYVRSRVYGTPATSRGRRRDTTGRAEGNERLTAMTGALLLALFAAEGVTILAIRQMLTLHFFLGMLLIGPVLLKTGSTCYRFARYYAGSAGYRHKGPPAPLLRLLGPFVILTSFGVIGTGVMLGFAGRGAGMWLTLHKGTFVLWFGVMTIHVLAYVWRLPRLLGGGETGGGLRGRAEDVLAGRAARWLLLTASVLTGLLLAVLTYHQAGTWLATHVIGG